MNLTTGTETTPLEITMGEILASITFADFADTSIVETVKKMLLTNYQETTAA